VAVDVLTETRNAAIDPSCQVGDMNWERTTDVLAEATVLSILSLFQP
jgi:hypothetical protein